MPNTQKNILVVEDNLAAQKAAQFLFKRHDCIIDCAIDGKEAVEMAIKKIYDAIYMDIGLPIKNGIEVCKAIRDYEAKNNMEPVPIIAVTANCSEPEIKIYLAAGMQEVFKKPLDIAKTIKFLSLCR